MDTSERWVEAYSDPEINESYGIHQTLDILKSSYVESCDDSRQKHQIERDYKRLYDRVITFNLKEIPRLILLSLAATTIDRERDAADLIRNFFLGMPCMDGSKAKIVLKQMGLNHPYVHIGEKAIEMKVPDRHISLIKYSDWNFYKLLFEFCYSILLDQFLDEIVALTSKDIEDEDLKAASSRIYRRLRRLISEQVANEYISQKFRGILKFIDISQLKEGIEQFDDTHIFEYWRYLSLMSNQPEKKYEIAVKNFVRCLHHKQRASGLKAVSSAGGFQEGRRADCKKAGMEDYFGSDDVDIDGFVERHEDSYGGPSEEIYGKSFDDVYGLEYSYQTSEEEVSGGNTEKEILSESEEHLEKLQSISKLEHNGIKYLLGTEADKIKFICKYYPVLNFRRRSILRLQSFKPVQDILQKRIEAQDNLDNEEKRKNRLEILMQALSEAPSYSDQLEVLVSVETKLKLACQGSKDILSKKKCSIKRQGFRQSDVPDAVDERRHFFARHRECIGSARKVIATVRKFIDWLEQEVNIEQKFNDDLIDFGEHFAALYLENDMDGGKI